MLLHHCTSVHFFAPLCTALHPPSCMHACTHPPIHPGFPAGQYAVAQGDRTGLGSVCWYVKRTREVGRIWRSVWAEREAKAKADGADGGSPTVVYVVAETHMANPDYTARMLECGMGDAGVDIDAIGFAPYLGPSDFDVLTDLNDTIQAYRYR